MPILDNPRWERFAQGLAAGKSADQAHTDAGYTPNRGNATRLKANEAVVKRVEELQARAADGVVVTRKWVLDRLTENANLAMAERDGSVANRALELLGKELGMFVDRAQVDSRVQVISDKPVSPDEWEGRYTEDHLGPAAGPAEGPGRLPPH